RGLASLIGEPTAAAIALPPEGEQRLLEIDQLFGSPSNPRKAFAEEDLAELADSIRTKGLVQPILCRPDPKVVGKFEIVAGERRWRAAQKAGLQQVPVIVRQLTEQEVLELAIIENVQRADLNAIEEANGYRELIERYGYKQDALAEVIGKSRSHLANMMRLLKLPQDVQSMVQQGQISAGHARCLIGREDAGVLARRVVDDGLSVREIEALVHSAEKAGSRDGGENKPRDKDADTVAFEKELSDALGLKVVIRRGSGESGTLIIKYGNFDQLDYIKMRLTGLGS
ncbi:MAG: ParB/RepB/Spo0J family partition protein, partial [Pseudomonadota bacterium]